MSRALVRKWPNYLIVATVRIVVKAMDFMSQLFKGWLRHPLDKSVSSEWVLVKPSGLHTGDLVIYRSVTRDTK